MLLAWIEGHATATISHPSLQGRKLLVARPLCAASADPVIVIDTIGAGVGSLVTISSDGKGTRETVGDDSSPARWTVTGIVDDVPRPIRKEL